MNVNFFLQVAQFEWKFHTLLLTSMSKRNLKHPENNWSSIGSSSNKASERWDHPISNRVVIVILRRMKEWTDQQTKAPANTTVNRLKLVNNTTFTIQPDWKSFARSILTDIKRICFNQCGFGCNGQTLGDLWKPNECVKAENRMQCNFFFKSFLSTRKTADLTWPWPLTGLWQQFSNR